MGGLDEFLLPERLERLERALRARTRRVTIVLENIFDPHNAAACLRTAEGLGLQDVYVVEPETELLPSRRVVQGADKWLDIHRFSRTEDCLATLKERGYKVYTTDLNATEGFGSVDFREPVALAFGNEHEGASPALVAGADGVFRIPMRGLTQSFNISVAAGITLFAAVQQLAALRGEDGDLSEAEQAELRTRWIRLARKRGSDIEAELARREQTEKTE